MQSHCIKGIKRPEAITVLVNFDHLDAKVYDQATQDGGGLALCPSPAWPAPDSAAPYEQDWLYYVLSPGPS